MQSMPERILLVFGKLNRGGAETLAMNIYRKIDRSKIQFDFIKHTEEKCDYDAEIRIRGGRIYSLPQLCHPRKNRHKIATKNGMNRRLSFVFEIRPHLFHGSLDNEPLPT